MSTTTLTSLLNNKSCSHVFICSCDAKIVPVIKPKEMK